MGTVTRRVSTRLELDLPECQLIWPTEQSLVLRNRIELHDGREWMQSCWIDGCSVRQRDIHQCDMHRKRNEHYWQRHAYWLQDASENVWSGVLRKPQQISVSCCHRSWNAISHARSNNIKLVQCHVEENHFLWWAVDWYHEQSIHTEPLLSLNGRSRTLCWTEIYLQQKGAKYSYLWIRFNWLRAEWVQEGDHLVGQHILRHTG